MVEPGARIADCLTLIDAAGHSIGHMAGVLESAGEGAVLAGDALLHPLHVLYPERSVPAYEMEQARATRLRLLDLCAEKNYWLAPAHFAPPHVCKVGKANGRYTVLWS